MYSLHDKYAHCIIGACYGDEGKGTVTAILARELLKNSQNSVINVLTNGGSQRGHTVNSTKGKFTFHHIGSSAISNVPTYISSDFIVNPIQFVKDITKFIEIFNFEPIVYIDCQCRLSTPYDMLANQIIERNRRKNNVAHGTCGMGIWETVQRYQSTFTVSLYIMRNMTVDELRTYFLNIKAYFELNYKDKEEFEMTPLERTLWNSESLLDRFIQDTQQLLKHVVGTLSDVHCAKLYEYTHYIFENGQGLMLSQQVNTDLEIYTTPSNSNFMGCRNALTQFGVFKEINVHYITRPYLTCHNNREFDAKLKHDISATIDDDSDNHYNEFQGEFRYSTLDINELRHRILVDYNTLYFNNKKLIIDVTHCDEMDRSTEFRQNFENVNFYGSKQIEL